jgi:uncharacterized integral membrane protein
MPEKQSSQAQTQTSKTWWIPAIIGVLLLMVPGGVFVAPVMFLLAVIMKRKNKPKEKSPETSPHSPLPLINTQP